MSPGLPLTDEAATPKTALKNSSVGLYQCWWGNMDEGWTRYVFDDIGIPYVTIRNSDFKAPKSAGAKSKAPTAAASTVTVDLRPSSM